MLQVKGDDLVKIRTQTNKMLDRHVAGGGRVTNYVCPHCFKEIRTIQPTPDLVGPKGYWDSLKTCIECGCFSMVYVWPGGETETLAPLGGV